MWNQERDFCHHHHHHTAVGSLIFDLPLTAHLTGHTVRWFPPLSLPSDFHGDLHVAHRDVHATIVAIKSAAPPSRLLDWCWYQWPAPLTVVPGARWLFMLTSQVLRQGQPLINTCSSFAVLVNHLLLFSFLNSFWYPFHSVNHFFF